MIEPLTTLEAGMPIVFGGDRVVRVDAELAAAFQPGDRLLVVQDSGALLHVPAREWETASGAVGAAAGAFATMATVTDEAVTEFYRRFASRLQDDASFGPIAAANFDDVDAAKARGRSTTRLVLSDRMRAGMVEGLLMWAETPAGRHQTVEVISHDRWQVEQIRSGLGVVGFVFEGRPNVFADATGVLRSGNTVVFRIGSDALGTARAIVRHALEPALAESGLPPGAVSLVDSPSRAAGWALFSDPRLGLAVARGSGRAVSQLGAVARQTGTPVSLHGTGGAWIVAAESADPRWFGDVVYHSLDRKVCNTLNTCCVVAAAADTLVPVFLDALQRAGERRGVSPKLHVAPGAERYVPPEWREPAQIARAEGPVTEPKAEPIAADSLGVEWEWEDSPEVTLAVVADVDEAVALFNQQSPKFAAGLVSGDEAEHQRFFETVDAPFVSNGFTRWVDGQYALGKPELGLSNWQFGRLFGRGGVLSGDSVFTVRSRVTQDDSGIGR